MKKLIKTTFVSAIAGALVVASAAAFAYSTTFTTGSTPNPGDYDGSWGPGDCGWVVTGAGGSGYGGGASYVPTKNCAHSAQSLNWTYNSSWNYYTVTITRMGSEFVVCNDLQLVPVETIEYVEQCMD